MRYNHSQPYGAAANFADPVSGNQHMIRYTRAVAATLIAALPVLGAAGCSLIDSGKFARGCEPPANEEQLLKEYRESSLIKTILPQSRDPKEAVTQQACLKIRDGAPTQTQVGREFLLSTPDDERAAARLYGDIGKAEGWTLIETANTSNVIKMCRSINEVPSFFELRRGQKFSTGVAMFAVILADTSAMCPPR